MVRSYSSVICSVGWGSPFFKYRSNLGMDLLQKWYPNALITCFISRNIDLILNRCPYNSMMSVTSKVRSVLTRMDRWFLHWTSTNRSSRYSPWPQSKSSHRNWTVSFLPYVIIVEVWNSGLRLLNSYFSLIVLPFLRGRPRPFFLAGGYSYATTLLLTFVTRCIVSATS